MSNRLSTHPASDPRNGGHGLAALGQQILNLFEGAGARAAARRQLASLTRRDLDDCGMTFADLSPELPDMFANDFRVHHRAEARAA